ncbi:MAG: DPP IV N-terminal domain-containing protein [Bacteroidales bacterium]|nr:DPP IV N-terminal domain-containing protein [Bacteroidales bacterium]
MTSILMLLPALASAQDKLASMPGVDNYRKMMELRRGLTVTTWRFGGWSDDGKSFTYTMAGNTYSQNVANGKVTETQGQVPATGARPAGRMAMTGERPLRGRQYTTAISPDGTMKAFYRDNNLWLSKADGTGEYAVTTEGNAAERIKYGSASWTYGEELGQTTAMWWSPDGKKIAYYRFDESKVPDYYVLYKQREIQDSVEIEPYVKVGANNPVVDIFMYDIATKKKVQIDVRSGQPFTNKVVGHYIYAITWSPDGRELLLHRTNRKQDIMEYCAANPENGSVRVIVREEWPASYTENIPSRQYLADNNRFIWVSERNGFRNFYLYDLSGKLISQITNHQFEVGNIVKVDEAKNKLYYMARSGDNHMKMQLHVVGLDGKGDMRLTDPAYNHTVNISPDNKYFIDNCQTHDIAPFSRLVDMKGKVVRELAQADLTKFKEIGLRPVEMFTYKAADGVTELHGLLHFPANFDPSRKYPVLLSIYGGPETNGASENFTTPSAMTEYGLLVVNLDSRSAAGRGKKFMEPFYGNLGFVEINDIAEGIKSLHSRPYFNKERVGVYGTSYGGFVSAMTILRHPDLFHASVANSAVTDFRNYDAPYTERFMNLLEDNLAGYENTSAMNLAANLKGNLMIFFGTSDNNVHPSNALQLIAALQRAGKHFEVQIGPDAGHTAMNGDRMMEFFIWHLVMN